MRSRIRGPTTGGIPRLHDIVKEASDANDNSSPSTGHRRLVAVATTKVECRVRPNLSRAWRDGRLGSEEPRYQPKY
jgi:hypothetical protein